MTSTRVEYALSEYLIIFIEIMDIDVTFLNAESKEDGYIESPVQKGVVLKLNKALCGLKQPLMEWKMALDRVLREDLKMIRMKMEQDIYFRQRILFWRSMSTIWLLKTITRSNN